MKRIKRKKIIFTPDQWDIVRKRAKCLKMKPATFIRNMSLHKAWRFCNAEEICLPLKKVNQICKDLNMVIKVAENTDSKFLEKLRELRKRFEEYRGILFRYYSQLTNND